WGRNFFGQLGLGPMGDVGYVQTPADVPDVSVGGPVVEVAGSAHTCARLSSGNIRCWGAGYFGQLGYGNTNDLGYAELPSDVGDVPVH
ncbi:MAG TPA: hypothetical protein VK524_20130, partial [Polyangiaceae bacterium]|nr:hypothetical protein [Polyangiaceae bacterium]